MSFLDVATPGFKALSAFLLPHDITKVRAGTAAHFLAKVIGHLEEGVVAKEQLIRMKVEQCNRKQSALAACDEQIQLKRDGTIKKDLAAAVQ